jgi:TetR/AcrR family tetracycline transcriptional repressor
MPGRPKIHEDLDRRSIAVAALRLVDRDGADALTLRRVAAELKTGTSTLYQYVTGRPMIVQDVVALLLDEVDTEVRLGETWQESVRRTTASLFDVVLRHPKAFVFVASVPADEPPLVDYARRIQRMHEHQAIPDETLEHMFSVLDAFVTGFLFLRTSAMPRPTPRECRDDPVFKASESLSAEAFQRDLEIVIRGISAIEGLPES